jgi:hypothetical protein
MDILKSIIYKEPIYYSSAAKMPLKNYLNYLESSDLKWFSNFNTTRFTKKTEDKILSNCMAQIFNEIIEITESFDVLEIFNKTHKILKMKMKYNAVFTICKSILEYEPKLGEDILNEKITMLKSWGYRISDDKALIPQIEKIQAGLEALKTEVEILNSEIQEKKTAEKQSFEKERLVLEMGLELRIPIDVENCTVERWFLLKKELEQKAEKLNRINAKKNK